jgi:hypothetical protein
MDMDAPNSVYLHWDAPDFRMTLTGTGYGQMNFVVCIVDMGTGETEVIQEFTNVDVVTGRVKEVDLYSNVDSLLHLAMFVVDESGNRIATVREDGSETSTNQNDNEIEQPSESSTGTNEMVDSPQNRTQVWIFIIAGAVLILIIAAILIVHQSKKKRVQPPHG